MGIGRFTGRVIALLCTAVAAVSASGATIDLPPPPSGRFVLDHAGLIDDADEQAIEILAAALFGEHKTPLVVVTIQSMGDHWPHGEIRIETFGQLLFDQWEIGAVQLDGESWNTGILLLVSKNDRKTRIQLGAGWGREKDALCATIMSSRIIPAFKRGRFGAGILAGAEALDEMARGKIPTRQSGPSRGVSPTRSSPGFRPFSGFGCVITILVMLAVSRLLTGLGRGIEGGGLGWGIGGFLLGRYFSGRNLDWFNDSGAGGGFGSGGFGGGFSGGGGASGGW